MDSRNEDDAIFFANNVTITSLTNRLMRGVFVSSLRMRSEEWWRGRAKYVSTGPQRWKVAD